VPAIGLVAFGCNHTAQNQPEADPGQEAVPWEIPHLFAPHPEPSGAIRAPQVAAITTGSLPNTSSNLIASEMPPQRPWQVSSAWDQLSTPPALLYGTQPGSAGLPPPAASTAA
jgi:hypothetical protein